MYEIVPSELKVLKPRPGTAVVEVFGEQDLATRDKTADLLDRLIADNELVVVDLTETLFIDSSFLNNLAKAQRTARERGRTVLLQVGTEPIVKRMLEISNFLTHFDHVSSREEALSWQPTLRRVAG
jgi:anti-anti-sigma factor